MSALSRSRGTAPVARLTDLPPVERSAIRCLRGWGAGPEARARMRRNFAQVFGSRAEASEEALDIVSPAYSPESWEKAARA